MRLHYFQHDDYEDLGYIGVWAASAGFSISVTRFDQDPILPLLDTIDWLVIMGGKMSVNAEGKHPWLKEEKKYILEAILAGKKVVGICLGTQLIASALGAGVYRNTQPEIGFFPVKFNKNASNDAVFCLFPEELNVLHLHEDTFQLPEGSVGMASSELTINQAFRYGPNVYAFQFHFEVTESSLPKLIKADNNKLSPGKWIQSSTEISGHATECPENNTLFSRVLDAIAIHE